MVTGWSSASRRPGKAAGQLLQCEAELFAGELGAGAGVGAETEGEVPDRGAGDVELVRARVPPPSRLAAPKATNSVAPAGSSVPARVTGRVVTRRNPWSAAVVPGGLLHGGRDAVRFRAQQVPLVRVPEQMEDRRADERGGGEVAGDQQVLEVGDGLMALVEGEFGAAAAAAAASASPGWVTDATMSVQRSSRGSACRSRAYRSRMCCVATMSWATAICSSSGRGRKRSSSAR